MLIDKKITSGEIAANNVKSTSGTKLTGTAVQNKNVFDKLVEFLAGKFNGTIDDLTSTTAGNSGAENIGATALKLNGSTTVGGQLVELKTELGEKVNAADSKNYTQSEKDKLAGIEANANNYVLPDASTTVKGGIKVDGVSLVIENGVASAQSVPAPDLLARQQIAQEISDRINADSVLTQEISSGLAEWSSTVTYPINAIIKSGAIQYTSFQSNNINHVVTDTLWWKPTITGNQAITTKLSTETATLYGLSGDDSNVDKALKLIMLGIVPTAKSLYNSGEELVSLTGGWGQTYKRSGATHTLTKEATRMVSYGLGLGVAGANPANISTLNKIDLTNYKKITFIFSATATGSGDGVPCFLSLGINSVNNVESCFSSGAIAKTTQNTTGGGLFTSPITLDVTAITGSYYVGIEDYVNGFSRTLYIEKVLIE